MQIDRRTVLASAVLVTALGCPGLFATSRQQPTRLVYDDRFPAARAWARKAKRQGFPAKGFSGDLTRLWRDELRTNAAPVTGMTTARALFCLEQLCTDHGWRIAVHDPVPTDGALVRWSLVPHRQGETRS